MNKNSSEESDNKPVNRRLIERSLIQRCSLFINNILRWRTKKREYKNVEKAIFSLPLTYREILDLLIIEKLNINEIAEITGLTGDTVQRRATKARKLLKNLIFWQSFINNSDNQKPINITQIDNIDIDRLFLKWQLPKLAYSSSRLHRAYQTQIALVKKSLTIKELIQSYLWKPLVLNMHRIVTVMAVLLFVNVIGFIILATHFHPNKTLSLYKTIGTTFSSKRKEASNKSIKNGLSTNLIVSKPINKANKSTMPNRDADTNYSYDKNKYYNAKTKFDKGTTLLNSRSFPNIKYSLNLSSMSSIYVARLGNDQWGKAMQAALIESLRKADQWDLIQDPSNKSIDTIVQLSVKNDQTIVFVKDDTIILKYALHKDKNFNFHKQAEQVVESLLEIIDSLEE